MNDFMNLVEHYFEFLRQIPMLESQSLLHFFGHFEEFRHPDLLLYTIQFIFETVIC